jgi:capsular polysaccharide transport system permease protein
VDANPPPELLRQPAVAVEPKVAWWRRVATRLNRIFFLVVALPTLLASIYYGLVASDVYISESRFVVRNPQRANQTGLGALLQGTALSRSQDETYSVHDFVKSRDALRELDAQMGLRKLYEAPTIDFVNRFNTLEWWDKSFEALFRHYLRHVEIEYDTVSSITVLRVRAYSAESALKMNEQLLEMGERLVNTMNLRSRRDLIQVAEMEVKSAESRAKDATVALSQFRSGRAVFDPDRQSALQLQGIAKLREELLAAQTQLEQVRKVSPDNPQIGSLELRVQALQKAVDDESARILGREGGLTAKAPAYDRLALEKVFAERQLATALVALDTARNEAARKQLYLERLVQPNTPDMALEPRRIRSVLVVFLLGLILWGVLSLIVSSVKEHTT